MTYLVAAGLILTAVLGQLLIAGLYLAQIEDALPVWARIFLGIAVALTWVFVVIYAWGKVRDDCEEDDTEENASPAEEGTKAQPTLRMP